MQRYEAVVVDRKAVEDDRFDDIEITGAGTRIRRQLKSSGELEAALCHSHFNSATSSLRFDRLVNTFTAEGKDAADEYRLCVTWQMPALSDPVSGLLVASDASGTFEGYPTRIFRLDPNRVWPQDCEPVFAPLQKAPEGSRVLGREEVIRFCDRFVVEVELPPASLDLDAPGPLERLLLEVLVEQVGIGRYPNGERRVEDVAALAIHVASTARVAGATLSPLDVAQRLGLRTDFGRVAQAFPLDRSVLQERLLLRRRLRDAIVKGGVHLVLAGPGSGKSWTLTQLAEDLEHEGLVVARHYCFLEPGDELVERRVTTDIFFGNLLGELSDAFAARSYAVPNIFAAGLSELETFLAEATDAGHHVVVLVDGLDHIARVRDASTSLSDNETDIVERLATLKLPEHVSLVVGSQPGEHLEPLREAFSCRVTEHDVEPWSGDEVLALAHSHGLCRALDDVHLQEQERQTAILDLLVQRCEGSPLYARYLSRGLVEGLLSGAISDPLDWLDGTPAILGDIARYYQYLYESASSRAKSIADILGVLDFSVTEAELREISGAALEDWVPEALQALSPVLTRATAQGGLRIFHESFRRFMLQELERRGRRLPNVLSPVVAWLETRDFFADAKSYRFTLPVMRRAGHESKILRRVSTAFVRDSVLHGHPYDAIERNLVLATDVAARSCDWPALLRCAELSRALATCFDVGTNNWQEYWQTYGAIYGAGAVAERLLFDGRPTLARTEGLLACESVDIAGATAPWQEYLALPIPEEEHTYSPEFDPGGALLADEEEGLAAIRGRLRLGYRFRVVRRVHAGLCHPEAEITSLFLRKLAKLLAEEISPSLVERIARRADFAPPRRYVLPQRFACALLLGLADAALADGDGNSAVQRAIDAMRHASTPEEAVWCMERGASPDPAITFATPPSSLDIGLENTSHPLSAQAVRQWVATIRLLARSPSFASALSEQRRRTEGEGWYRCWLRYVLTIAQAEAASVQNMPYDIRAAFTELIADTRPFHGKPRACDLYSIRRAIDESLARGISLVSTHEEWKHAIDCISQARSGTATRLDREDGGPITAGSFFSTLLAHASTPVASNLIIEALERELVDEEANGTYYSIHAEFRMRLARLHARSGQEHRALDHWRQAGTFLIGYGFHKDITLFDVIDSVPALLRHSEKTALRALVRLQPLLGSVFRHTDRRETRNTPNAWFRALLKVNAVRAIELLCRDFMRDPGLASWMAEQAQEDVLRHLLGNADPMLLDALWETLLFEIQYENEGAQMAGERLGPLEPLAASRPEYVKERFVRLCAEALDDARRHRDSAIMPLRSFAKRHGLAWPWLHEQADEQRRDTPLRGGSLQERFELKLSPLPAFPAHPRLVDIMASIRRLLRDRLSRDQLESLVVLPLSYHITEMAQRGEEAQARRLLHFFVHETPYWSFEPVHPVATLAQCLDQAGHAKLAAVAHALAFTSARGGRGWLNFGDRAQAAVLRRAMELDKDLVLQTLAEETARKLRLGGFDGIAKHLIEQISDWGDHELAARAWDEAFAVIESRLPLPGEMGLFESLDAEDVVNWSADEALAALLLVRIGNPALPRKVAALSGFARLLHERPCLFQEPIRWLLTRDATVSTAVTVLQILLETPVDVTELLRSIEDVLESYVGANSWSLSLLAEKLLHRAGRPFSVTRLRPVRLEEAPSHRGRMLARYGDVGEVMGVLQHLWSDLPAIVARRMQMPTVDNETFNHYVRERMELASGRRTEAVAPAPVLSWPSELFIAVLDEALMGLYEHLWNSGEWDPEVEEYVLGSVLPFLQLNLALDSSRVPRPNWPRAHEGQDQLKEIVRVPEDDSVYGGWIRLGLYEQCFYRSDDRDYLPPDRVALQFAAVVRTELDGTVPASASPVSDGDVGIWWHEAGARQASMEALMPQLVKVAQVSDWLGQKLALVPPPALQFRARLQSPGYAAPLRWYDRSGTRAVVLRTWRVRGNRVDTEWHTTLGADLLMRPDFLEVLLQVYGGPLKELQRVHFDRLNREA